MTSYGDYLRRAIRSDEIDDWSSHYLAYHSLKKKIVSFKARRLALVELIHNKLKDGQSEGSYLSEEDWKLLELEGKRNAFFPIRSGVPGCGEKGHFGYVGFPDERMVSPTEAMLRLSNLERAELSSCLNTELDKPFLFSASLLVKLAKEVDNLKCDYVTIQNVGNEILETYAFALVNVITLRQILIRYDAFLRTYDGKTLTKFCLKDNIEIDTLKPGNNNVISNLFHLRALKKVEKSFIDKLNHEILRREKDYNSDERLLNFLVSFQFQINVFHKLLDKTLHSVNMASEGHIVLKDKLVSILRNIRHYFLLLSGSNSLALESGLFLMRGRDLKEEIDTIVVWMERKRNNACEEREDFAFQKIDPENVLPLIINLLACFLYMMNNYIIEPSSAYYANALGSSDAMSGLMLSMSPWFALSSSIGYSYWTNYSYRSPLLFGGVLMTFGNFIYGSAYSYNSMLVCLIGRSFSGLGAPRIINRRYIADSTPFSLRTAASAAFSLATALGAAFGPGVAIILDYVAFEFELPFIRKQYFNGMTGPGYLMSILWFLYTLVIFFFFKEPTRSGLEELKKREKESSFKNEDSSEQFSHTSSVDDSMTYQSDSETQSSSNIFDCFKHITRPVIMTMSLIFMKRIALENIVGATSVVTKNRYGWNVKNVGTLHLVNGLIVIPVSILAGWLSQYHLDRYLALWFLSVTLFGMVLLLDLSDIIDSETEHYNEGHLLAVGSKRYVIGSLIAFSGIEAGESFVVSLMSKVVPSSLASGVFNSGLLATLVGTSGRATGDVIITILGLISIRNLLNLLIVPSILLVLISISWIRLDYDLLAI